MKNLHDFLNEIIPELILTAVIGIFGVVVSFYTLRAEFKEYRVFTDIHINEIARDVIRLEDKIYENSQECQKMSSLRLP